MYRLLIVSFKINRYDGSWTSGQQSDGKPFRKAACFVGSATNHRLIIFKGSDQ
jgi:hypothetical protein